MMGRAAEIHAKFFPQAQPICRYTREQINEAVAEAGRRKIKEPIDTEQRGRRYRLANERWRQARPTIDAARPIHIAASPRCIQILQVAATLYGISMRELVGANRARYFAYARAYAAARLHDETPMSWTQIGKIFNRDHTSMLNLVRPKIKGSARDRGGVK